MAGTLVALEPSGEVRVTLCAEAFVLAEQIGHRRSAEAKRMNRPGRAGCPPNNLEQDVNGAAAEVAVARAIGAAPSMAVGPSREADVEGLHVRSTPRPNGRLIVRPGDSEDNLYVLVVGQGVEWRVIGTVVGRDALRPEYWYDENGRPGCYMVPQQRLARMRLRPSVSLG